MKIMIHSGGANNAYHAVDKINPIVKKKKLRKCF